MINKVNRPPALRLISNSKAPENNPGESQGSGMSYERHQKPSDSKGSDPEAAKTEPTENAPETRLPTASEVDQLGMTEVVKDLLEHKADTPPANAGLTTTRYSNDSSPAKGLLLNKKAE